MPFDHLVGIDVFGISRKLLSHKFSKFLDSLIVGYRLPIPLRIDGRFEDVTQLSLAPQRMELAVADFVHDRPITAPFELRNEVVTAEGWARRERHLAQRALFEFDHLEKLALFSVFQLVHQADQYVAVARFRLTPTTEYLAVEFVDVVHQRALSQILLIL